MPEYPPRMSPNDEAIRPHHTLEVSETQSVRVCRIDGRPSLTYTRRYPGTVWVCTLPEFIGRFPMKPELFPLPEGVDAASINLDGVNKLELRSDG